MHFTHFSPPGRPLLPVSRAKHCLEHKHAWLLCDRCESMCVFDQVSVVFTCRSDSLAEMVDASC